PAVARRHPATRSARPCATAPPTTCFLFSSRRRHTSWPRDWSSDVCSSDLAGICTGTVRTLIILAPQCRQIYQQHTSANNPRRERSEEHTSELQSRGHLVCRLLLEKKNTLWTN